MDNNLKRVKKITDTFYTEVIPELELIPDEKYLSANNIRSRAYGMFRGASMLIEESVYPSSAIVELEYLIKDVQALFEAYKFAGRHKFITIDPDLVLELEDICSSYKKIQQQNTKDVENFNNQELKRARELKDLRSS